MDASDDLLIDELDDEPESELQQVEPLSSFRSSRSLRTTVNRWWYILSELGVPSIPLLSS